MESKRERVVPVIRELLEFVNDGVKGYRTASEEARDPELRDFCLRCAAQREKFVAELNAILTACGVDPEATGTIRGAFYRQWMEIKAAFTNSDDEEILSSCLYGEEWALRAYDEALESSDRLPLQVVHRIKSQRSRVQQCYAQLKEMETLHHH